MQLDFIFSDPYDVTEPRRMGIVLRFPYAVTKDGKGSEHYLDVFMADSHISSPDHERIFPREDVQYIMFARLKKHIIDFAEKNGGVPPDERIFVQQEFTYDRAQAGEQYLKPFSLNIRNKMGFQVS